MFYAVLLAPRLHSVPFTSVFLSQVIKINVFFMIVSKSFWTVYAADIIDYFNLMFYFQVKQKQCIGSGLFSSPRGILQSLSAQ